MVADAFTVALVWATITAVVCGVILAAAIIVRWHMRPPKPERDPLELMAEDAEKIRKVAEMYEAQSRAQMERMGSHE